MMKKLLVFENGISRGALFTLLIVIFANLSVLGQMREVTGKVLSGNGDSALVGATVRVKGANTSAITGPDGSFTIKAAPNATLIISNVGYDVMQIDLKGSTTVMARLNSNSQALQQVVVVGYGTVKKKDLTGSVASIGADVIQQTPVTSLEQSMQGKAAGVQITANDGSPGANINVLIRGTGSIANNANGPLYVVDGYPLETGGINNVNPTDIATIDILKDASATAIYGVRAANGVVIITTKKGKRGNVQISVDAYEAFQTRPKEYKVLNAQQFALLADTVAAHSNGTFQTFAPWQTPDSLHNLDWQNAIYKPSLTQNYTVSIRGGSDKVQTSTSLAYYGQQGIVDESHFKRFTMATNLDYQPTSWLRSSTSLKYSRTDLVNPYVTNGQSLLQASELPPTMDGGNAATPYIKDGKGNYGFYNPIYVYVAKYSNPIFTVENNKYQGLTNWFLMNSSLEATILPGLRIKTNAGVTYQGANGYYFQPEDDRLVNQYGAQAGATQNAAYSQYVNTNFDWLWENTIAYDKSFGLHNINFVGGYSAQKNQYTAMAGSGIPPNNTVMDLSQSTVPTFTPNQPLLGITNNGQVVTTLLSEFGRLNYNFDEKYFVTGTIRRDGSSKFPANNQYGVFPSGAVKWAAKQENFMKDLTWLSDLNIRGSYGETGNAIPVNANLYQAIFAQGSAANTAPNYGYTFGNPKTFNPGIYSQQPQNNSLGWETDFQTDFGVDAGFLGNHLTLTADWFDRKSKNFLVTHNAPAQSGYLLLTNNFGSMENKGIELALAYNHTVSSDFSWNANLTFTTVNNRLTSLLPGDSAITNTGNPLVTVPAIGWVTYTYTKVGQPVGEFYGYHSLGIFQSQSQIDALNTKAVAAGYAAYQKTITQPGDRYFADLNHDGTVNASDETALGSPIPKFYSGLTLNANYKAWDFSVYFYGVYGNKIFNFAESSLESFQNRSFVGVENISQNYYENAWTPQNHNNTYARITSNDDAIGSNVASDAYIEDGSYIKVKNLMVGYTIPTRLISPLSLQRVRFYFSTQNLFTITGYKGLDPEIGYQGGNATQNGLDNGTYPSSRYYTVGLNVTFK